MSLLLETLRAAAGLALLLYGAEVLVRHAKIIGLHFGLAPVLVGATIVAFGTSAPELVVSLVAAVEGAPSLALGNLLGSNIANITLVLGATALLRPIATHRALVRREYLVCLVATLLLTLFAFTGDFLDGSWDSIGRGEGLLLATGFVLFFWMYLRDARKRRPDAEELAEARAAAGPLGRKVFVLFGLGLGLLLFGSTLVVEGGRNVAEALGVPASVIGATLLAVGTSLPELATTIAAARQGESDMAIGNVLGSNLFNILFVLGPVAALAPFPVTAVDREVLLPLMVASTLVLGPMLAFGQRVTRPEGTLLLLGFALYLTRLVVSA